MSRCARLLSPRSVRGAEATAQSIESMLRNQPGIHSVKVALLAERALVEYDPEKWTVEKIAEVRATICQPARPASGLTDRALLGNLRHWLRRYADTTDSLRCRHAPNIRHDLLVVHVDG